MTRNTTNRSLHKQDITEKTKGNASPVGRCRRTDTPTCAQAQTLMSQE